MTEIKSFSGVAKENQKQGQGKVILIVGRKKTGKTTVCKELCGKLFNLKKVIFDINGHYPEYGGMTGISMKDFLSYAQKSENSLVIFEEATVFFSTQAKSEEMLDLLIRCRHTNNIVVFVFHSLRSVPNSIFEQTDVIALKKTNDVFSAIKRKYADNENLFGRWERINEHENPYYFELFENVV